MTSLPALRARDGIDDGVVCLAMVLAYFGKARTMAQCRVACASGCDGFTVEQLIEAARRLGLWAEDWVIQGAAAFDVSLSLPAIVSWHGHYFVVVERVTRTHVTLLDPAVGRRRLTRELFDRFCSGVAVTFVRGGRGRRLPGLAGMVCEAFETSEARWMAGLLVVATIVLQVCGLALPVGMLLVFDHILHVGVAPSVFLVMATVLLVVVSQVILQFVRSEALVRLRMDIEARWRHRGGEFGVLGGYLVSQSIVVCLDVWLVIFSFGLVAVWSPVLAAVAVGFCVLQVGVAGWASKRRRLGSLVDGLVSGIRLGSLLGLLVVGAHEVLAGRLTMAGMLALNVVAAGVLIPLGEMVGGVQRFLMARERFERLCEWAADEWGAWDREREGWR